MKQYTKIDYSGYIPLCEHYPINKSGFNFRDGGLISKFLGWNFLGFNCLFTGSNEPVEMIFGIFRYLNTR